jgi:inosose dehydratase
MRIGLIGVGPIDAFHAQAVEGQPMKARPVEGRVAGAPISWGVREVPGWGYQLPVDRVLAEMRAVGLTATEFGPDGYLPSDPAQRSRLLAEYGLTAAGCLDTGHLLIGGTDPAQLACAAAGRIGHVHLKDVAAPVARRVASGELTYTQGVAAGLYRPLGQGDVDIAGVVAALEAADYRGWYVLEQDTILHGPPTDEGPARAVRESLYYLRRLFGGQQR